MAHQPGDHTPEDIENLKQCYLYTKELYNTTFGHSWPEYIWRGPDYSQDDKCISVNLIGLILTHSIRVNSNEEDSIYKSHNQRCKQNSQDIMVCRLKNTFTNKFYCFSIVS